ncbi:MAG: hypothetical protein JKY54_12430 [Flavobacteriales bacterium]|nr:hypothetical protein [Flavobacteriales bacterium]
MSTHYNLRISISQKDLKQLHASGTKIAIGKSNGTAPPNVVWQSFKPLSNNSISWNEEYGIYTSDTPIQNGATIRKISDTGREVQEGELYTADEHGSIVGPSSNGLQKAYHIQNNSKIQDLTVGLTQNAHVNGVQISANVVSAVSDSISSVAVLSHDTSVYIWLDSLANPNTIVSNIPVSVTKLSFPQGTSSLAVIYNSATGKFS